MFMIFTEHDYKHSKEIHKLFNFEYYRPTKEIQEFIDLTKENLLLDRCIELIENNKNKNNKK